MAHLARNGRNALTINSHSVRTLLLALLRQQPISRARLARETRLSTTTVTNLVTGLIEQGIVVESGVDPIGTRAGAGRQPKALRLRPESRCVLGIHVGGQQIRVALVDLQANVIDHQIVDIVAEESGEHAMARAGAACRTLIDRHVIAGRAGVIVGVGVGASGLVQSRSGWNVFSPNLGWHDVHLRDLLEAQLGLPVVVDNNVRCMALAENLYGVGRNVRALAFVYAGAGVGAGLVVDGEIYHGADFGAGEIGHWVMSPTNGELCSCGNRGCLETYISERVLLALAEEIQPELTSRRTDPLNVIFDSARDGHLALVEMLEQRAEYLGLALANLVNVLNPELIMLGGWPAEAFDLIAPVVENTMRRRAFGGIGDSVDVLPTTFGVQCGVIGAAVLALESFVFSPQPARTHAVNHANKRATA